MTKQVIEIPGARVTIYTRHYSDRDYTSAPRLYVDVENETVLDNLANRKRRPYNVYKKMIRATALDQIFDLTKLSWSQKAGCSCPCSPGFILNKQSVEIDGERQWCGFDIWVTLTGAPSVDERKPARELALL